MRPQKTQGWREQDGWTNNARRLEEPGRMLAVSRHFFNRLGTIGAIVMVGRPTEGGAASRRHHFSLGWLKIKAHSRLEG